MTNILDSCPNEIMPFYIDFAVTYGCNAKCKHCSINAVPDSEYVRKNDMSFNEICSTIDQLKEIGVIFIGLTGGEAITRCDIVDIVKYCKKSGLLVALATNGMAMTESLLKTLRYCGLNSLFVSLDHYSRDVHNEIRQNERAYEGAMNGIRLCQQIDFPITVGITPMKYNYKDIGRTIDFLKEMGVRAVNVSNYVPVGRGKRQIDLTPEEWRAVFHQVKNRVIKYKDTVRIQLHDVKTEKFLDNADVNYLENYKGCLAGYTHCYILPNGDVQPCVMLPICLGNVKHENIKSILLRYQRSNTVISKEKLKGHCGKCPRKYECGGCRATAYAYYADPLAEDPHCWFSEGMKTQ